MKKALFLLCLLPATAAAAHPEPVPSSATVRSVSFSGNTVFNDDALRGATGLQKGTTFQMGDEEIAAGLVKSHYQRNGYLEATATATATSFPDGWDVRIRVEEGPLYHFGTTRTEGLKKLPARIADFERRYKPGDPYVRSKLFETQSALYGSGYFDDVTMSASTTPAKTADVLIRLKEKPYKWLKGGVGYGSEERERATLILEHDNLFRRAYHGQVEGTWSAIWREYDASFVNPYLFGTRTTFQNDASWRKEFRSGYTYERTRGQTSLGRELKKHLTGTVGLRADRNLIYNLDPSIGATTPDLIDARAASLAFNWDNANDFFFPTRGARVRSSFERFGGALGGALNMHRVEVESYHYYPLTRSLTVAAALRGGWSDTFGPTKDVPVFERFFIGGGNTVRGYKERDIGRHDENDSPLGGRKMAGATAELRFPIVWRFRGALFVDGGEVDDQWSRVRPAVWKYGAGGGIRFVTPVGPFRLDVGYKLNRDPGDLSTYRIHFSLGESF